LANFDWFYCAVSDIYDDDDNDDDAILCAPIVTEKTLMVEL
jgi:hypothetical protein